MTYVYRFIAGLIVAAGIALPAHHAAAEGLQVAVNRSEIITLDEPMKEVMVADPVTADVVVHGTQKVSIIGRRLGRTSVRVLGENSKILRDIDVQVGFDLADLRRILKNYFPDESIAVETVSNNIALSGIVSSVEVAEKAVRIAKEYVKEARGLSATGNATTTEEESSGVINLMQIRSGQQVMLRVRVGEIQRSALKRLGASLGIATDRGGSTTVFEQGNQTMFFAEGGDFDADPIFERFAENSFFGTLWSAGSVQVRAALDALERDGMFRILAEPNLVAISGERAEFLAGGEFPIPVVQGNEGQISVTFRQFGVAVQFLPIVLSEDRIRLQVQPEVSELSEAGSISVSGFNIPALSSRRARTTIELSPGETLMIAGLIRDQTNTTVNETPGLSEVPILSSLFRNTSLQRTETELVIVVTPYLVDPVTGTDVKLPTDNFQPPSVMDMFFYGALGAVTNETLAKSQRPRVEGNVGFMMD